MAKKYAEGRRAWGICQRGGHKVLLRNLIPDGRYPNLRVDPEWWEPRHPLEFLAKVEDPIALNRPSPEVVFGPTAPVLTGVVISSQPNITWTPSESGITEILSYTIFRGVDGAIPTQYLVCAVQRDFLGGIIGVAHCTTIPSIPTNDDTGPVYTEVTNEDAPITYVDTAVSSGHTYCYYVTAQPMGNNQAVNQGPNSAPSNTVCLTIGGSNQATTPTLSGSLSGTNVVLNWTASTIVGSTIAGYQVWRNVDAGLFSLLTTTGNVLTDTDTTTTTGHTYGYYVIAVPVVGLNSNQSNRVFETPSSGPHVSVVTITNGIVDCQQSNIGIDAACVGYVPLTGFPGHSDFTQVSGGALVSGDASNLVYTFGISSDATNGFFFAVRGSFGASDLTSIVYLGNDAVTHTLVPSGANFLVQTATDPGNPSVVYTFYNWYSTEYPGFSSMQNGQNVTFTVTSPTFTL